MSHRRHLAVLTVALALAGTLALPSGAAPLFVGQPDRVGDDVALALAWVSALVAAAYVVSVRRTPEQSGGQSIQRNAGWFDVGVLGAVAFLGYPFVGFPAPTPADGSVVNLYVHLLGFCLGFVVPYVALATGAFGDERRADGTDRGFLSD